MAQTSIVTAIDIGTDKCVTLIAQVSSELKTPQVLGVAVVPSKGMRRSQIIDLEKVLETITESVDGAERMAGIEIKEAYVSVSGTHVHSLNSTGVVAVASPDKEITDEDVSRVIEAARAISLPSDKQIIHVIPNTYKVDSQDGIKDPVGMTGVRLESSAHIITGLSTTLTNVQKCIEDLGLKVAGFVFSGLAAAEVVLSETEKELGVALVDIGAGSTSVCVYADSSLVYSVSLPVGARHITQDIALGCRISLDVAEKVKVYLSKESHKPLKPQAGESKADFNKRKKKHDELRLADVGVHETQESLSKQFILEGIMEPRIKEIFSLIAEHLEKESLLSEIPAGVVLTGGGAETAFITQVAKSELKLPARIGEPVALQGLTNDIQKPAFATSIGLIMYGEKQGGTERSSSFSFGSLLNVKRISTDPQKIIDVIKSLLP